MGLTKQFSNFSSTSLFEPKDSFEKEVSSANFKLQKRLQFFGAIFFTLLVLLGPASSYPLLFFSIVIPSLLSYTKLSLALTTVYVCYLTWIFVLDWKVANLGSRKSSFMRSLPVWKWYNNYFPIRIVKTPNCNLDSAKNYLFCSHPHGLICLGVFGAFSTNGNPDREKLFKGFEFSLLVFKQAFIFPIYRDIALRMGLVLASREAMNNILSKKGGSNVAVLMPGGAPEVLDFCPGKYILQLKERKGFVKVALQNGAPLVPVFTFGENIVYNQLRFEKGTILRKLQDFVQSLFSIPPSVWYGRGFYPDSFGLFPHQKPLTVVVGAPLPMKKTENPTPAQINELHKKYVEALTKLFYDYREKYSADPNDELIIT